MEKSGAREKSRMKSKKEIFTPHNSVYVHFQIAFTEPVSV